MKNMYFLLLLSLFVGCSKDEKKPDGITKVQVNGVEWEFVLKASKSRFGRGDLFELDFYINRGEANEQYISVGNIKKNKELQRILYMTYENGQTPDNVWGLFVTSQESDVIGDVYNVIESDSINNWIKITDEKDDYSKLVKGEFSITFVRTKKWMNSPLPDTLKFRNGTFVIDEIER